VMKEVRASVCSARALSAASRYPGTLPTGRRVESSGRTDRRDGSNVPMSRTGVVKHEAFGVVRWIFALKIQVVGMGEREERGNQSLSEQENSKSGNLRHLPVQVRNLRASSLVDKCAAGFCSNRPCEGLRGFSFTRRDGDLWRGIHRRETPGRREQHSNSTMTSGRLDGGYR
jgi:hypothetical protein